MNSDILKTDCENGSWMLLDQDCVWWRCSVFLVLNLYIWLPKS